MRELAVLARQPSILATRIEQILALMQAAAAFSDLDALRLEVARLLGGWPVRWGHRETWGKILASCLVAPGSADGAARAAVQLELALLRRDQGDLENAMRLAGELINDRCAQTTPAVYALAASSVAAIRLRQGDTANASAILDQCEADVRANGNVSRAVMQLCVARALLARRRNFLGEAIQWSERALAALSPEDPNDRYELAGVLNLRGVMRWVRCQYSDAQGDFAAALALYRRLPDPYLRALVQSNLGLVLWSTGKFYLAERAFLQMIELGHCENLAWQMAVSVGNLSLVYLARGQLDEALQYSEKHFDLAERNGDQSEIVRAIGIRGTILFHQGRHEKALPNLDFERLDCEAAGSAERIVCNYVSYARCLADCGEPARGRSISENALEIAREADLVSLLIIAMRVQVELGDPADREALLREALVLAHGCGRKLDEAACWLSFAAFGEGRQRRLRWRRGARLLRQMGATAWLESASPDSPPMIVCMA